MVAFTKVIRVVSVEPSCALDCQDYSCPMSSQQTDCTFRTGHHNNRFRSSQTKIPSEMEVAPRCKLLTLLTLSTLVYTIDMVYTNDAFFVKKPPLRLL